MEKRKLDDIGEWLNIINLLYRLISTTAEILAQIRAAAVSPADFDAEALKARIRKVLDEVN